MGINDYCSALYLLLTVSWCHHLETYNSGLAPLVICYIPIKTTVFWLINHWHYIRLSRKPNRQTDRLLMPVYQCWASARLWCCCTCLWLSSDLICKNISSSVSTPKMASHLNSFLSFLQPAGRPCPTFLHPCCVAHLGDHESVSNYWGLSTRPSA